MLVDAYVWSVRQEGWWSSNDLMPALALLVPQMVDLKIVALSSGYQPSWLKEALKKKNGLNTGIARIG